ncbi:MAG: SpoIVB peptidase [Peptococcaceae bacterium]|nr:SpoIVB peptidase [Peptococcaceae bacterium]
MNKTGRIRIAAIALMASAFFSLSLFLIPICYSTTNGPHVQFPEISGLDADQDHMVDNRQLPDEDQSAADLNEDQLANTDDQYAGEQISTDPNQFMGQDQSGNFYLAQDQQNRLHLLPGGQSIGISLQTQGVLVVGYAPILNEKNEICFPAKEVGINLGDVILSINGVEAVNDIQVAEQIDSLCQNQQDISLEVKQGDKISIKSIKPIYCKETNRYRVGLYIRDEAAGVGTLTFMEPQTQIFGALGHVITDVDTHKAIDLENGKVVESSIHSIQKSQKGQPGEKIGSFQMDSPFHGAILKNSTSGIFGNYQHPLANSYFPQPIPIGYLSEVKKGPAKIYTVLQGNTIGEFEVQIEKIMSNTGNRNFVIRITDPVLLEVTGGIVQGMSGSPIIQDGKLIGAVTHVFVNDAARGYGISIENMIKESGISSKEKAATALRGGFFSTQGE